VTEPEAVTEAPAIETTWTYVDPKDERPSVQDAVNAVMRDVQVISKDQKFDEYGVKYSFRGIDDVVNAVGPKLREHRVVITPVRSKVVSTERYETKRGAVMQNVIVRVAYNVVGPRGDWLAAEAMGQSADAGDKAIAKAQSVAYRVMLLGLLCIPTGEVDPDSENHERAATRSESAPAQQDNPGQAVNNQIGEWQAAFGWNREQVFDAYSRWNGGQMLNEASITQRQTFVQQLAAHHLKANAPEAVPPPEPSKPDDSPPF